MIDVKVEECVLKPECSDPELEADLPDGELAQCDDHFTSRQFLGITEVAIDHKNIFPNQQTSINDSINDQCLV